MDLDRAGVELGKQGQVVTDPLLRTSAAHIFAVGDCTTPLQFTHVGDEQGRLAQTIAPSPTYALGLRLAAARAFGEFGGATWRPAELDDRQG